MSTTDQDFQAQCDRLWQSLSADQVQAWQDYADGLGGSLTAYEAFMQVNTDNGPNRPSQKPPHD